MGDGVELERHGASLVQAMYDGVVILTIGDDVHEVRVVDARVALHDRARVDADAVEVRWCEALNVVHQAHVRGLTSFKLEPLTRVDQRGDEGLGGGVTRVRRFDHRTRKH